MSITVNDLFLTALDLIGDGADTDSEYVRAMVELISNVALSDPTVWALQPGSDQVRELVEDRLGVFQGTP